METVNKYLGISFLFCNGIETPEATARDYAKEISEQFDGQPVEVFYNPTKLERYTHPAGGISSIELAAKLARKIFAELAKAEKAVEPGRGRLILFVHSHGTELAKYALEHSSLTGRTNQVRVYSFGSAALIPRRLAAVARHYIFKGDMISEMGNFCSEEQKFVIQHRKRIKEISRLHNCERGIAVNILAAKNLLYKLYPLTFNNINTEHTMRLNRINRYQAIFEAKTARIEDDPDFQEDCASLNREIRDYDIEIIDDAQPAPKSFTGSLVELIASHGFERYLSIIRKVKEEEGLV